MRVRDRERQKDRLTETETERQGERESWCFTPSQPLRLYQGDEGGGGGRLCLEQEENKCT